MTISYQQILQSNTTVIANIRATLHDPQQYPNPFKFDPGRFIPSGKENIVQQDPLELELVFGFGRGIFPVQHVAEATLFIQMATFLAFLQVLKNVNESDHFIEPKIEFTTAIVRYVSIFNFLSHCIG